MTTDISIEESRRLAALQMVADHIEFDNEESGAVAVASEIVKAARVFEAYLDGTDRAAVPAKGN